MMNLLLLLLAADGGAGASGALGSTDGGAAADAGRLDPRTPATWTLSARLSEGSPAREALIAELVAAPSPDGGAVGETALTAAEAQALLADPRAQLIYGDKTVLIAAPSMLTRQRKEHLDLMRAFLAPERIAAGAGFAREHAEVLDAARLRHGVEPEAIVGILMWETRLGTITGDWLAFNALASQAFFADLASAVAMAKVDERQRLDAERQARRVQTIEQRAHRNLVALVRQCKTKGIDPLTVKGSWAGALGFPQFMPASLRWAEDGDGDGAIDLYDFDDAIASVARYLAAHGWAKSPRQAVWGYNHEDAYVDGVLAYATALKKALASPPPATK